MRENIVLLSSRLTNVPFDQMQSVEIIESGPNSTISYSVSDPSAYGDRLPESHCDSAIKSLPVRPAGEPPTIRFPSRVDQSVVVYRPSSHFIRATPPLHKSRM